MYKTFMIRFFVLTGIEICAVLSQSLDTYNLTQEPAMSSALSFSENSSAVSGNTSPKNVLNLRCDPIRFGRNLRVESCRKAFGYISHGDMQTVFAERDSGQPHDFNLPFRVSSSECPGISNPLCLTVRLRKNWNKSSTC